MRCLTIVTLLLTACGDKDDSATGEESDADTDADSDVLQAERIGLDDPVWD